MASGSWGSRWRIDHSNAQVQQGQSSSPKHYYPHQDLHYSVAPSQYMLGLVQPVTPYYVNLNAKCFDPTVRCEYHSNTQGHSTENCWTLKRTIENLINGKTIVIHNEETVTNNPPPAHNNAHVVGMISDDKEYKQMGGMITTLSSLEKGMSMDINLYERYH
ncbi:hypothetical protein HAX54_001713 [Datura stramonium]|uniref:Uncharacterized protein n=1 Tax=Datura stramonium TaxID=4076 RepID=A0ABS8T407_DATST|nr:hypothetical protein [Datura stramonium]